MGLQAELFAESLEVMGSLHGKRDRRYGMMLTDTGKTCILRGELDLALLALEDAKAVIEVP